MWLTINNKLINLDNVQAIEPRDIPNYNESKTEYFIEIIGLAKFSYGTDKAKRDADFLMIENKLVP